MYEDVISRPHTTGQEYEASNTGDLGLVTRGFNDIARTLEQASMRSRIRLP